LIRAVWSKREHLRQAIDIPKSLKRKRLRKEVLGGIGVLQASAYAWGSRRPWACPELEKKSEKTLSFQF
jgi:hypothetical protein